MPIRTIKELDALPVGDYSDAPNLIFSVTENGTRNWKFRFVSPQTRKRRKMGLGPYPIVSAKDARSRAMELNGKVQQGIDPMIERDNEETERVSDHITLDQAMERVFERKVAKGELKDDKSFRDWWGPYNRHVKPTLGGLRARDITHAQIQAVMKPIWTTVGGAGEKAARRTGLGWREARRHDAEVSMELYERAIDLMPPLKISKAKHGAISWEIAPRLYSKISETEEVHMLGLRFYILSVVRVANVVNARWDEINFDDRLWTIPRIKMKNYKRHYDHSVPLTDEHLAILELAKKWDNGSGLIFPSPMARNGGTMSKTTWSRWITKNGYRDWKIETQNATAHGFRRTFKNWVGKNRPLADRALADEALDHTTREGVSAVYFDEDTGEQRRPLFDAWAQFVTHAEDNVVALRG